MAEELNGLLAYEVQKFATDNMVELYQLDASILSGPTYYFTSNTLDGGGVYFNEIFYTPLDMEVEGFEYNGQGPFPQPKIRVSNANEAFNTASITYGDLVGATLTRIKTFKSFLDDGDTPDPTVYFPLDIYNIERKSVHNPIYIEWELSAAIDQQGKKIPGRQLLKNACTHRYRIPNEDTSGSFVYTNATCPYTGSSYFNQKGDATAVWTQDVCGKRFSDCVKRFGEYTPLPFRGFPGIGVS